MAASRVAAGRVDSLDSPVSERNLTMLSIIRRSVALVALFAASALAAATASAQGSGPNGILAPSGINPATGLGWADGDTYHLAFVTSSTRDALSTNINDYHAFVNAAADASILPGVPDAQWFVIGAIVTAPYSDAKYNAPVTAPVYNLNGELVATGYADLWDGSIVNPISHDENGVQIVGATPWTGATSNGTRPGGAGWLGSYKTHVGNTSDTDSGWIHDNVVHENPDPSYLPLYGLSEPLTLDIPPVAEPAGLGVLSLAALAMRKRRS
jgi:hypothetical protein